jgi:hypothetical protein
MAEERIYNEWLAVCECENGNKRAVKVKWGEEECPNCGKMRHLFPPYYCNKHLVRTESCGCKASKKVQKK